jgi:small subunit ribosomal protein S7
MVIRLERNRKNKLKITKRSKIFRNGSKQLKNSFYKKGVNKAKKMFYLYPSKRFIDLRYYRPTRGKFSFRLFFNQRKANPVYIIRPFRNRYNYISRKADAKVAKRLGIKLIYKKKKSKFLKSKRLSFIKKASSKVGGIFKSYNNKRLSYKRTIFRNFYAANKSDMFPYEFSLKHKLFRICVGHLIKKGRKSWAERILSDAFFLIKKKYRVDPPMMLLKAISLLKPTLGLRPKKKGGVIYRVPFLLKDTKQLSLAIFWLLQSVRQKLGPSNDFSLTFCEEINDIVKGKMHSALKKKDEIHKLALTNRPFLK